MQNGLSDDFGPPFTKPENYLLSCNATVAKGIMLSSQHFVLVIQMEFPPRKEKLPKCQETPINSGGGGGGGKKNTYALSLGG